jgi:hypothetical protein
MFRPVVQQSQAVADQSLVIAAADVTTKVTKKKEILCFRCELMIRLKRIYNFCGIFMRFSELTY